MRYTSAQIVFQEVPNEISLAFMVSGCPLKCAGCHSHESWNQNRGEILSVEILNSLLDKYLNYITCVVFLGGEWEPQQLILFLDIVIKKGLKTCLYTGLEKEQVPNSILEKLTYLKYGPYIRKLGGLDSKQTNQRFVHLASNEILNSHFYKQHGGVNDSFG